MRFVLAIVCLVLFFAFANAQEKAKSKAKAEAALALVKAGQSVKESKPLTLDEGKTQSLKEKKPLLVWVGCGPDTECAGQCLKTRAEVVDAVHVVVAEHEGSKARRTILYLPKGEQLERVIQWEYTPTPEDVKKYTAPKVSPASVGSFFIGQDCPQGV